MWNQYNYDFLEILVIYIQSKEKLFTYSEDSIKGTV